MNFLEDLPITTFKEEFDLQIERAGKNHLIGKMRWLDQTQDYHFEYFSQRYQTWIECILSLVDKKLHLRLIWQPIIEQSYYVKTTDSVLDFLEFRLD